MTSERTKAMDDLIAQDADLIDTVVTDADREVFIRLSGPDDEGANRIRRGLTYTWEVGLIARHRQAAYAAGYQAAADHIEALEAEVERLRFHLDTALEALIMEGVCDGECGACKAARAALSEPNKGDE